MAKSNSRKREVTLETIDKKLSEIERKIGKIPKTNDAEKSFIISLLFSFSFVLLSVSIPLMIQMLGYEAKDLTGIIFIYMVLAFGFIFLARKISSSKK